MKSVTLRRSDDKLTTQDPRAHKLYTLILKQKGWNTFQTTQARCPTNSWIFVKSCVSAIDPDESSKSIRTSLQIKHCSRLTKFEIIKKIQTNH